MITKFKIYESINLTIPRDVENWKIGDYVICIDHDEVNLTYGKKYKILDITHRRFIDYDFNQKESIFITVDSDENDDEPFDFFSFVTEDQFKEMKFNL